MSVFTTLKNKVSLASVQDLQTKRYIDFMRSLNSFAKERNIRQYTNWSKVWEYPWLWFNGLKDVPWQGTKLIDLGSELSPMPWYISSLGANVTLVENNPQFIEVWEAIKGANAWLVDWRIVQDEHLPFDDGVFDLVTSFSVIEHQLNKELAVSEVARILKSGGVFFMSFDVCEPSMGMTFPAWNGLALTTREFEKIIWNHPAFVHQCDTIDWNLKDSEDFINWHLQSAPYHNYTVGAAILIRR